MYVGMLIDIFFQLSYARPPGMNGPSPIPWTEIHAWCLLNDYTLTPFELQIIKMMDITYLHAISERQQQ